MLNLLSSAEHSTKTSQSRAGSIELCINILNEILKQEAKFDSSSRRKVNRVFKSCFPRAANDESETLQQKAEILFDPKIALNAAEFLMKIRQTVLQSGRRDIAIAIEEKIIRCLDDHMSQYAYQLH